MSSIPISQKEIEQDPAKCLFYKVSNLELEKRFPVIMLPQNVVTASYFMKDD